METYRRRDLLRTEYCPRWREVLSVSFSNNCGELSITKKCVQASAPHTHATPCACVPTFKCKAASGQEAYVTQRRPEKVHVHGLHQQESSWMIIQMFWNHKCCTRSIFITGLFVISPVLRRLNSAVLSRTHQLSQSAQMSFWETSLSSVFSLSPGAMATQTHRQVCFWVSVLQPYNEQSGQRGWN